jgi:uncharacterized protein (TIGR02444 family)
MGEAFWRFSLTLYTRPGMAEALLRLQDRDGCDINLILFALWSGAVVRRPLTTADLARAEQAAAPLREVVEELRQVRRRLKQAAPPELRHLRRRVAVLELVAERRVQHALAAAADPKGDPTAAPLATAAANLALYLGRERAASTEAAAIRAELGRLIRR